MQGHGLLRVIVPIRATHLSTNMSSACALVPDAPPSFTLLDMGKIGFAQVGGQPNAVTIHITRPGVVVLVGSDAMPVTSSSYQLTLMLPATAPKLGDAITITASLSNVASTYTNKVRVTI